MTLMFPYMMLITMTDFWNYKLRDTSRTWNTSDTSLTDMQRNFPSYLGITGNLPLPVLVIFTAIFGYKLQLRTRLLTCAGGMLLCFIIIQVMVSINTDTSQSTLFIMMIVTNTIYSSINAVAQTSFLGNIGRFPPSYIGSANDGIGLGGILPALLSIIILAISLPVNIFGVISTSCCLLTLLLTIPGIIITSNTVFYQHYAYGDPAVWSPSDYAHVFR